MESTCNKTGRMVALNVVWTGPLLLVVARFFEWTSPYNEASSWLTRCFVCSAVINTDNSLLSVQNSKKEVDARLDILNVD